MKKFILYTFFVFIATFISCNREPSFFFNTTTFSIEINHDGYLVGLIDPVKNINYLPEKQQAPLMAVVDGGHLRMPSNLKLTPEGQYQLGFDQSQVAVILEINEKKTHLTFRILDILHDEKLEAILWGPYPTIIGETIGENIGVVRNHDFAIGIQSLNPKTTAGKLDNIRGVTSYFGTAADSAEFGSTLQAFAIDRTKDRTKSAWDGWENKFPGRPLDILNEEEGSIKGSSIALFGCKPDKTLETIGAIEVAEGLPHPEINGVWAKLSKETNRAYVISPFSEEDVDVMINYTKEAGLRSLYHEDPFETWGHFELKKEYFPHGVAGLKMCVDKARAAGLNMGIHTLTNFITPNDKFVTPIPDRRLVITGLAQLDRNISATDTEIGISDNQMILNQKKSTLNTVRIGDELIRYSHVSESDPFILYDCQRGSFDTKASVHARGDTVVKLLDFAYKTFYPNWEMQKDMVRNIANLINETGITQMGFDGHEGCYATGQGDYAMDKYALDWYNLADHVVVNSSSRLKHFYWHINHFINWGEPWYGGFRESQTDRRFKIQPFLERNYLKNMLGWFMITKATMPSDIEWMMAKAAGYNAGFALVLRRPELENNPHKNELLDLIRTWEEARLAGAFTLAQRELLKDMDHEFHLEKLAGGSWTLHPFLNMKFVHTKKVLQPGEPTSSEWSFTNSGEDQPFLFSLTLTGKAGKITNPDFEFDHSLRIKLPEEIDAGTTVACDGSSALRIYDSKGRFIKTYDMVKDPPRLRNGVHHISFDGAFSEDEGLEMRIVIKQKGEDQAVRR